MRRKAIYELGDKGKSLNQRRNYQPPSNSFAVHHSEESTGRYEKEKREREREIGEQSLKPEADGKKSRMMGTGALSP